MSQSRGHALHRPRPEENGVLWKILNRILALRNGLRWLRRLGRLWKALQQTLRPRGGRLIWHAAVTWGMPM